MKNIIPAMRKYHVSRIISLTGTETSADSEYSSVINNLTRWLLKLFAKRILDDSEQHIKLLTESGLNWTVIRSPVMNNIGTLGNYKLTNSKPLLWATINRASVALAMIKLLNDQSFVEQAPYIQRT